MSVRLVSWNIENSFQSTIECPENAECDYSEVTFENPYDSTELLHRTGCLGVDAHKKAYLLPNAGARYDEYKTCKLKKIIWKKRDAWGSERKFTDDFEELEKQEAKRREEREEKRREEREERRREEIEDESPSEEASEDEGPIEKPCWVPEHPYLKNLEENISGGWTPKTFVYDDSCIEQVSEISKLPAIYVGLRMKQIAWTLSEILAPNGIAALQETDEDFSRILGEKLKRHDRLEMLTFADSKEKTLTFVWDKTAYTLAAQGTIKLWPVAYNKIEDPEKEAAFQQTRIERRERNANERDPTWELPKSPRTTSNEFVQIQPRLMLWGLFTPIHDALPILLVGNVHFKAGMEATQAGVAHVAVQDLKRLACLKEKESGMKPIFTIVAGDTNYYALDPNEAPDPNPNIKKGKHVKVLGAEEYPKNAVDDKSTGIDRIFVADELLKSWKVKVIPETVNESFMRLRTERDLETVGRARRSIRWQHHARGQYRISDHAPVVLEFETRTQAPAPRSPRENLLRKFAAMHLRSKSPEKSKRRRSASPRHRRRRSASPRQRSF